MSKPSEQRSPVAVSPSPQLPPLAELVTAGQQHDIELCTAERYPLPWDLDWKEVVAGCYQLEQAVKMIEARREGLERHAAWSRDKSVVGLLSLMGLMTAANSLSGPVMRAFHRCPDWADGVIGFVVFTVVAFFVLFPFAALRSAGETDEEAKSWTARELALRATLANYQTRRAYLEQEAKR